MKGWIWALGLSSLVSMGFAQDKKVVTEPNVEKRTVEAFDAVEVSGAIELIITQSEEQAVAITAERREDIARITTEVRNGVLVIRYKDGKNWWQDQWNTMGRRYRAYVSAPAFRSISTAGSGAIRIEGTLKSEDLNISLSGSGNIDGRIEAENLELMQSGSGNVRLTGKIANADVRCSGSGNFRSADLEMDICEIALSGSGNADITVNKELSARVSGSGNVRYRGAGMIRDMRISGSGKIRKVDSTPAAGTGTL